MYCTPVSPGALGTTARSRIKFLVWYSQRVPSWTGSLTSSTASAKTLLTSSFVSRVQLPAVRGIELVDDDFGVDDASGASGATVGAVTGTLTVGTDTGTLTAGTVGFGFGRVACPHPASRLAPSRMTTVRIVPNFFIFLSFRNGYCNCWITPQNRQRV